MTLMLLLLFHSVQTVVLMAKAFEKNLWKRILKIMSVQKASRPITEDCKVFSCRMCRKMLFTSHDFLPHDNTKDAKGHKKFKFQAYGHDEQKTVCTSLFLDPDLATWVAKESRDTQTRRLDEMEKAKAVLEDEEIFGPGGRPKTPPMSEEQLAALVATSDDKETQKASQKDSKAIRTADEHEEDEDSDEEIISSEDETPAKRKTDGAAKVVKPVSKPPTKGTAVSKDDADDSDDEILDDDDDDDEFGDDFADDDDDFKSVSGAGGSRNAARRKEYTITKAAIDIVDPDTIYCFHCQCKVGAQNWIGSQCSCGAWVTPSFKIHAKAVDEIPGSLYLRLYK